jgi:hypothetical protein
MFDRCQVRHITCKIYMFSYIPFSTLCISGIGMYKLALANVLFLNCEEAWKTLFPDGGARVKCIETIFRNETVQDCDSRINAKAIRMRKVVICE